MRFNSTKRGFLTTTLREKPFNFFKFLTSKPIYRPRASVLLLLPHEGKEHLVVYENPETKYANTIKLIGGGFEKGKDSHFLDCVRRELKEEMGIDSKQIQSILPVGEGKSLQSWHELEPKQPLKRFGSETQYFIVRLTPEVASHFATQISEGKMKNLDPDQRVGDEFFKLVPVDSIDQPFWPVDIRPQIPNLLKLAESKSKHPELHYDLSERAIPWWIDIPLTFLGLLK